MAAPSPSTNPSRPLSNGRDARSGSSLRMDSARIAANAAMFSGRMAASVPPARTTSARPDLIISRAYPMASAPDAQALTVVCTPARAFSSMPSHPAEPFGMSIGTVNGDRRCQPFSFMVS